MNCMYILFVIYKRICFWESVRECDNSMNALCGSCDERLCCAVCKYLNEQTNKRMYFADAVVRKHCNKKQCISFSTTLKSALTQRFCKHADVSECEGLFVQASLTKSVWHCSLKTLVGFICIIVRILLLRWYLCCEQHSNAWLWCPRCLYCGWYGPLLVLTFDNFCYPVSFPPLEIFIKSFPQEWLCIGLYLLLFISTYWFPLTPPCWLRRLFLWQHKCEAVRPRFFCPWFSCLAVGGVGAAFQEHASEAMFRRQRQGR